MAAFRLSTTARPRVFSQLPTETTQRTRARVRGAAAFIALGLAWAPLTAADDPADRRTKLDYMSHCEGCHHADGSGMGTTVPSLRGEVGKFLATQEGREYLVRVPGTAQALLDDEAIAKVLNWMLRRFDPMRTLENFRPYEAAEVGRLRREPISRPSHERARIIANLPPATISADAPPERPN
jgi:cytochrome c553